MCFGGGQSSQAQPQALGPTDPPVSGTSGSEQRGIWAEKLLRVRWLRGLERAAPWQRTAPFQGGGARSPPAKSVARPGGAPAQAQRCRGGNVQPERGTEGRWYAVGDYSRRQARWAERRVAGHPDYQAVAEETDAAW